MLHGKPPNCASYTQSAPITSVYLQERHRSPLHQMLGPATGSVTAEEHLPGLDAGVRLWAQPWDGLAAVERRGLAV